jgi:chloramphenicol-sensitive protein RarD
MENDPAQRRRGVLYGIIAYAWWGLVPLYFRWVLGEVSAAEMLAHRIVWSLVFLVALVTFARRWREVARCFRTKKLILPLTASSLLVGANWLIYIRSVEQRQVVQASLGYFLLPLVSVFLGLIVFREKLRRLQWIALGFALVGGGLMVHASGQVPWIAVSLAVTFSVYGLIRKQVPVDGLIGLAVETIVLMPLAVAYLAWRGAAGELALSADNLPLMAKLALSGIVTAVPLLCFGQAARMLPFSMLGFMQYISPSIQFLLAVLVMKELPPGNDWTSFVFVWLGLLVFTLDSYRVYQRERELRAALEEAKQREESIVPSSPLPRGGGVATRDDPAACRQRA